MWFRLNPEELNHREKTHLAWKPYEHNCSKITQNDRPPVCSYNDYYCDPLVVYWALNHHDDIMRLVLRTLMTQWHWCSRYPSGPSPTHQGFSTFSRTTSFGCSSCVSKTWMVLVLIKHSDQEMDFPKLLKTQHVCQPPLSFFFVLPHSFVIWVQHTAKSTDVNWYVTEAQENVT